MGKLVIKHQGNKIDEVNLKLGDTVIGRDPSCDIVLKNDKSVSKKHAVFKTVGMNSSIEDLGSTNGTFLGDRRIKRHQLKSGDTLVIGEHELVYRDEASFEAPTFGARPAASAVPPPEVSQEKTKVISGYSQLVGVIGDQRGRRIPLVKDETLIDNPGKNPARVYRTPDGFVLSAQVGPGEPRINDRPVPPGGQILESGDVIEVAGTKYQFTK